MLDAANVVDDTPKVSYVDDEAKFRWELFSDEMAFDKLHEGVRKFAADGESLKDVLRKKLAA
jgi:transaldolase